jgi:lipid-A-disaccharide synthase
MNAPTIFISAGELSGDMHGGALVAAIKKQYPDAEFLGIGGDSMRTAGVHLIEHFAIFGGVMGFGAVFKKIRQIYSIFRSCVAILRRTKPAILIVIDFPDFNLRLAKACKRFGIPVLYFIPPKVWAWREGRVKTLRQYCASIASILPFEKDFYDRHNAKQVTFVGHPFCEEPQLSLLDNEKTDLKSKIFESLELDTRCPTLLVLAGSRKQEIEMHVPVILRALHILKKNIPSIQVIFSKAPTISSLTIPSDYSSWVKTSDVSSRVLMQICDVGIIKSGTSTLEAAFAGLPSLCIYMTSPTTAFIGKRLIGVNAISLPNLICKDTLTELVQETCTPENIASEVTSLFTKEAQVVVKNRYNEIKKTCSVQGIGQETAYDRVASIADKLMRNQ